MSEKTFKLKPNRRKSICFFALFAGAIVPLISIAAGEAGLIPELNNILADDDLISGWLGVTVLILSALAAVWGAFEHYSSAFSSGAQLEVSPAGLRVNQGEIHSWEQVVHFKNGNFGLDIWLLLDQSAKNSERVSFEITKYDRKSLAVSADMLAKYIPSVAIENPVD